MPVRLKKHRLDRIRAGYIKNVPARFKKKTASRVTLKEVLVTLKKVPVTLKKYRLHQRSSGYMKEVPVISKVRLHLIKLAALNKQVRLKIAG